jgi:hypothetical protein
MLPSMKGTLVAGFAALLLCGAQAANAGVALNTIDPHATHKQRGALVHTSGPIGCTSGERIAIAVRVSQAATGAKARGSWSGRCTGAAQHWHVRARARRGPRFANGLARVCAVGKTRLGSRVTDTRRWCRQVAIDSASGARLPDAELLAANTTAVITDPADPRLDDRLLGYRRDVVRIIRGHGGRPRGSRLLDGVFFSSLLGTTTFERSRDFDVDLVSPAQLRDIADTVRREFHQQSVLTFDYPERPHDPVDAVEVEVPGVDAERLRAGFSADSQAQERLQGGSVTLDGRLILIAALADVDLVERFVTDIGGDFDDAALRPGRREFVG